MRNINHKDYQLKTDNPPLDPSVHNNSHLLYILFQEKKNGIIQTNSLDF